ncbi:alpha/beta hydrolase [Spongiimicrobium salis]|uniref:alpha/beta hydrolase n=1 Tax=Spongiimicrobium salis TaxID=1667022 RepID=UPI00374D6150
MEKQITYATSNSYSTRNTLLPTTKNVWIVLHGIGYLSRYFLRYFDQLPQEENYLIAPQAPSKYYLNDTYTHIGASWLTKENTETEIHNVLEYLEAVRNNEAIPEHCKLVIFGYSQGVSIAARWVAKKKFRCTHLVLYSGSIPNELVPEDFLFLEENNTKVITVVGDKDPYITKERYALEVKKTNTLFKGEVHHITFQGAHEVKRELIPTLLQ